MPSGDLLDIILFVAAAGGTAGVVIGILFGVIQRWRRRMRK